VAAVHLLTWLRSYAVRAIAIVLLTGTVIVVIDWGCANLNPVVQASDANWWGHQEEIPYWADAIPPGTHLHITSRALAITIAGGRATATYTVTAPAESSFIQRLISTPAADSGNDLANNVLGAVRIAEFRYGFTGPRHSFVPFSFGEPQLSFGRGIVTVSVASDPVGLYFTRQYIEVDTPSDVTVDGKGADQVSITPASVQTAILPGGSLLRDTANSASQPVANLSRGRGTMQVTVAEGGSGQGWLDGLRGIGGIEVPFAETLLVCLSNVVVYLVLLWALHARVEKGEELSQSTAVAVARRAVLTIIVGLGAVAVLGTGYWLTVTVTQNSSVQDALTAGPVGLLVSGTLVAWPVACARLRAPNQPGTVPQLDAAASTIRRLVRSARSRLSWTTPAFAVSHLALAGGYLEIVHRMRDAAAGAPVPLGRQTIAWTLTLTVLVPVLARLLLGGRKMAVPLVSAGLLAGGLATTVAWPLLIYYAYQVAAGPVQVNVLGKCIFLAAAVAAVVGLILMTAQVAAVLWKPGRWRLAGTTLIATGIALAVIPDASANVNISDPTATGLVATDLINLFDALPELLDWLVLGLAIAVVMQLPVSPTKPDARPLARRLALPIAVTATVGYGTWLYLPVSVVAGLVLIWWLVLPSGLISKFQSPREAAAAKTHAMAELLKALTGWRHADFATGQRQALSASGTETLRSFLIDSKTTEYDQGLAALADAQESLALLRARRQHDADQAKSAAFAHYGDMPDKSAARHGAVAGAILGVVPAAVTLLTTAPPSSNTGYALLDFLGWTAWPLFEWTVIGWFVGYYLPLLRGSHGTEKALWLFLAAAIANLPLSIIWDDPQSWAIDLTDDLQLLVFLMLVCVYVSDLLPLKAADLRLNYWAQVHNWRFVVTWSTALVAAIGTAAVTFLTVATTDLVNNTLTRTSQQSSSNPANPSSKPPNSAASSPADTSG
jgi:hypothetical protein